MRKKIFIPLIIIVVGAIMTAFFCKNNKYKDLRAYTERLLKIEWNDCIESAAGNVETIYREEVAHVKLEVRAGYEEEALSIVKNRFGQSLIGKIKNIIPPGEVHEFATEIKNSNLEYASGISMEGNRIKTRNVDVVVFISRKSKKWYI